MSFITVKNITKTFKVPIKKSGIKGALKSFFNREYKYIDAIKDISFSIDKGEIVGYIGPNGAGKSTTIKILSGILTPDKGTCKIDGMVPWAERREYVQNIGVVFGQRSQLWWDIPAEDTFDLLKDIYNLDEKEYQNTKKTLIELLNLEEIVNIPIRQLSLGQRMRCEIASALLHRPKILFLDEPTIGLDAYSKKVVRDFIKKLSKDYGVTVMLTTHDMNDIEALANRVIMIGKGRLLYDGTFQNIKKKYDIKKYIMVETKTKIDKLKKKGIIEQTKTENGYKFIIDSKIIDISSFLNYLSTKIEIIDIEIENENLDSIIISLYKEYKV